MLPIGTHIINCKLLCNEGIKHTSCRENPENSLRVGDRVKRVCPEKSVSRKFQPALQTAAVFCILNHLRGRGQPPPPLPRRSVETYRLGAAGAVAAPPGKRLPTVGRSLALPSLRLGAGIANAGGTDPGAACPRKKSEIIKGAIESERGKGWWKGDGCSSSPPPAQLCSLGLWRGRRRG